MEAGRGISAEIKPRVALVLWAGAFGGAETLTVDLATALRRRGLDARIIFVCCPGPLRRELERRQIPFSSLGLRRGRNVIFHPRRLANLAAKQGRDGAILCSAGCLAASLRVGGYRGRIIASEHGEFLQAANFSRWERWKLHLDWWSGIRAVDVLVAVSDALASEIRNVSHAEPLVRIYNGVDLERFRPATASAAGERTRLVTVGRLYPGKGIDVLLHALAQVHHDGKAVELHTFGDGQEAMQLRRLAQHLGVSEVVTFHSATHDPAAAWQLADVGVVPSASFVESFGKAAVEAMACEKPVIATRNGGLAEVVDEDTTGLLVEPANADELAAAIARYHEAPELRRAHGQRGRERCADLFDIERCADGYQSLLLTDA